MCIRETEKGEGHHAISHNSQRPKRILSPRLKKGAEDRAAEESGITPTMYLEVDGGVFLRLESTLTASSGSPQGVGRGREIKKKSDRHEWTAARSWASYLSCNRHRCPWKLLTLGVALNDAAAVV